MAWPRCASGVLRPRQRLARCDQQLRAHQVDAGDLLGDRMLDLQPRVHLEEIERAATRRRRPGTRPCRRCDSRPRAPPRPPRAVMRVAQSRRERSATGSPRSPSGAGAAPSTRARTGARRGRARRRRSGPRRDAARSISRSTYSVPSPNAAVASRRAAWIASSDLAALAHAPHALAAAAGRRLDRAPASRRVDRLPRCRVGLIVGRLARHDRHAGGWHQPPRLDLRSHARDHVGRRADEGRGRPRRRRARTRRSRTGSRSRDGRRRRRSLRAASTIAGIDEVAFRAAAAGRWRPRDRPRARVRGVGVGVGVHRDALDAQLAAGADDADRDLAAVGDEDAVQHRCQSRRSDRASSARAPARRSLFEERAQAFLAFGRHAPRGDARAR